MSDHLTTLEAAKLLNTTDRTIRRKLSAMGLKRPHLVRYVRKEGKTILIDIRLVYGNFERLEDAPPPPISGQAAPIEEKTAPKEQPDFIAILIDQLSKKDEQLKEKDDQIKNLTATLENLTTTTDLQNKLLDNLRLQIITPALRPPKRTFLQWLFRRK